MRRDARPYLADVLDATALIDGFVAGLDFDAYLVRPMVRSAVERQLEIVGAALNGLSRTDPGLAARIPDLPLIVGLRNVLAHGYHIVDHEVVWTAATVEAPSLAGTVAALLAEVGE